MPKHYRSSMLLVLSLFLSVCASAREVTGKGSHRSSTRTEARFRAFKFAVDNLASQCYMGESLTELAEVSRPCTKDGLGYECTVQARGTCTMQAKYKMYVTTPMQAVVAKDMDSIPAALQSLTEDAMRQARGQCESQYNKNKLAAAGPYGGPTDGEGNDEAKCRSNPNGSGHLCFLVVLASCQYGN